MKILIAQLATETNTFAAFPTGLGAYEEYGIFHGDASRKAPTTSGDFLLFLRNLLEGDGHEVVLERVQERSDVVLMDLEKR